jgi:hypothetical protein
MADGFYDIACTGFAFGAYHRCAFTNSSQSLTEITRSTHKWDGEEVFIDMEMLIGWRQYFRFVDAIYANRLEDLGFDKMSDTALGHDRNGHRFFNL